jgi:DNA topoisomerase-1
MVMKEGRYGRFLACSGYPSCKNIKSSGKAASLGMACPECEKGDVLEKRTRRGKIFYGCSRYPDCQFATWSKPIEGVCPECGSLYLVEKASKRFGLLHKCPNKQCNYRKEVGKQDAENEQAQ